MGLFPNPGTRGERDGGLVVNRKAWYTGAHGVEDEDLEILVFEEGSTISKGADTRNTEW